MSKSYEERINVFESKKRKELGDYQFLKKYIKKYTSYIKLFKGIVIPFNVVYLLLGVFNLIQYFNSKDSIKLILGILISFSGIIWIINYIVFRYYNYVILQSKIEAWTNELNKYSDVERTSEI